jgi:hypothetical protein
MSKTGPGPVLWFGHQTALHRIPVHVLQLFGVFFFPADVEVIVPDLPEGMLDALPGNRYLQRLYGAVEFASAWLADEKVNVFRHYNVARDEKVVSAPHFFEACFE